MLSWIRHNNKKIMAVLGVFLMIAFVADFGTRGGGGRGSMDSEIGTLHGETILAEEFQDASVQWQILNKAYSPPGMPGRGGMTILEATLAQKVLPGIAQYYGPVAQFLGAQLQQEARMTANRLVSQMDATSFLLLLREANDMGVRVNEDVVQEWVQNFNRAFPSEDAIEREIAIRNWLTILEAFDRIGEAPKVSIATAVHDAIAPQEQIALQLVDFTAADFRSDVPVPTEAQLSEFFAKYRDVDPETSEYGIGYRYPNRVKVEYLVVPIDQLKKTITYEEVYKYYKDNPERFPATMPATTQSTTQATTQAATRPASQPAAATRPKTPSKENEAEIRNILANQYASALATYLRTALRADWPAFREATRGGTTLPAQLPQTSVGVPFNETRYLERLQQRAQQAREARGVLPPLEAFNSEFRSKQQLASLPGIGQAQVTGPNGQPIPFAEYVIGHADAFLSDAQRKQAPEGGLRVYQPAEPIRDAGGNYYLFRITAVDPAHPAETLAEVRNKVRDDWVTIQAYEKAKQAAKQFYKAVAAKGLNAPVTRPTTRPVVSTGLFSRSTTDAIPGYVLAPAATRTLVEGGFKLLAERLQTGNSTPVGMIDLPRAVTVVVAQLQDARPAEVDPDVSLVLHQAQLRRRSLSSLQMISQWFNGEQIVQRTGFQSSEPRKQPAREQPQQAPGPIIPGL